MSKFVVDLNESKAVEKARDGRADEEETSVDLQTPKKRGRFKKALGILGVSLFALLLFGAVGGYFYWQHLKRTPQYSLALMVDAARKNDQKALDELIDTDALVDDFMPQITDKAVELYGRNLPPATIDKARQIAAPLLPAVKIRARAEIPALIRDKVKQFDRVPFWAIALAASRYVDIVREGDKAFVASKIKEQSDVNFTMKQTGERWQIVAVKDEELARSVAEKIGQQIIFAANKGGIKRAGEEFGVENLNELIKQLDTVFK